MKAARLLLLFLVLSTLATACDSRDLLRALLGETSPAPQLSPIATATPAGGIAIVTATPLAPQPLVVTATPPGGIIIVTATPLPAQPIVVTATPPGGVIIVTATPPADAVVNTGELNLRSGPGTAFSIIAELHQGDPLTILGRNGNFTGHQLWFLVQNAGGLQGWVAGWLITLYIDVNSVPIVQTPVPPPTAVPPTPTPVPPPTAVPPTPTPVPPIGLLDFTQFPTWGVSLSAGFTPDPYHVAARSGGPVDVSYLGGNCYGFATSKPHFLLTWSGASPRISIYFQGPGDTTLVVHDPLGNWRCDDDSAGGLNPLIRFSNPPSGEYHIWIASCNPDEEIRGRLLITEMLLMVPSP
jgi:hypothetical protein